MSKEHFWPDWMKKFFPRDSSNRYAQQTHHSRGRNRRYKSDVVQRPGHLTTMKFRVVCRACNQGWMNQLEITAKPLLTQLIRGEEFQLDRADQQVLAQWVVMKTLVAEHADPSTCVTPVDDRVRLATEMAIPGSFNVHIGIQHTPADSGYVRHSATLSKEKTGPQPPLNGLNRNTQSVTFICGRLVVFVVAARVHNLDLASFILQEAAGVRKLVRIQPISSETISWPPIEYCSDHDLAGIAYWLDGLISKPNVNYVDEFSNEA